MSRAEPEFEDDEQPPETAASVGPGENASHAETVGLNQHISDSSDEEIYSLLRANLDGALDYYALLGLARVPPPTVAQIRSAYHRLSLAFHPDKHPQSFRVAAQKYFTKLQKAYETLIEPRKRVIYDLEGEIGVQNEYKVGGAMGQDGEGERQIGVKTMGSDEFREWFLGVLRERERRAIGELVGSSGTYKLLLSAQNIFNHARVRKIPPLHDEGLDMLEIPVQPIALQGLQLRQSFSVPLPRLGTILQAQFPSWRQILRGQFRLKAKDEAPITTPSWESPLGPYVPKLTIIGGVGGPLLETVMVTDGVENNPQETAPPSYHWHEIHSDQIQISARLDHTFPQVRSAGASKSITSMMQATDLEITTGLLPRRALHVGIGHPFTILEGTSPFYCHLRTFFNQSVVLKPPVIDFRVTRSLGENHTGYFSGSSGDFAWPTVVSQLQLLPISKAPLWLPRGQLVPSAKIGYLWMQPGANLAQTDEDDEVHTIEMNEKGHGPGDRRVPSTNQSCHLAAESSPYNAKISVIWGRDLFVRASEHPVRSRFMINGEATRKPSNFAVPSSRKIRLEVEGEMGFDSSFSGIIRGVRGVGNFTNVALGVGLNPHRGLFITMSWSRLGQNVIIPVVVLSADEVDFSSVLWAVAVPWATYIAVEFGILLPRLRRQRQKLAERKRKELQESILKSKAEAEQILVLMRPMVEHRQAIEEEDGGLVILRAEYGVRAVEPGSHMSWRPGEVADVTVPLAALVDGGQLSLPRSLDRSQIIGFWDPAPFKKKTLRVEYLFGGKRHRVEVGRHESLSIPMRGHEREGTQTLDGTFTVP